MRIIQNIMRQNSKRTPVRAYPPFNQSLPFYAVLIFSKNLDFKKFGDRADQELDRLKS